VTPFPAPEKESGTVGLFDKVKDVLTRSDRARGVTRADAGPDATQTTPAAPSTDHPTPTGAQATEHEDTDDPGTAAVGAGEDGQGSSSEGYRTHTVRPGDTLDDIAAAHGVGAQDVIDLNGIDNPDLIYPGQVFKIPHS
jgi:LysM repeat protein